MEITYIGHSCFKIKGKNLTLVIDPYDPNLTGYKLPKLTADVVLSSHAHEDHHNLEGVTGQRLTIDEAGEYEASDVYIEGIPTFHDANGGTERGKNIMYQISIDDFNILHMGDLGHELSKETLEKIVDIDVLIIPVGGTYTIDAKTASKVISSIEPGFVVPMHYQTDDLTGLSEKLAPLKSFLDEMGLEEAKSQETLKINSESDIPDETEVVVLNPAH